MRLGWTVLAWDRSSEHLRLACERGAAGSAAATFADLVAAADTVVLATPLDATLGLLRELAQLRGRAPLVLDTASLKTAVAAAGAALPRFVATHPIAGSERSGPLGARADLFDGRMWSFDSAAPPGLAAEAAAFITAMGGVPFAIESAEHDRIAALTSHLPQVLSVALGAHLAPELDSRDVLQLCGTGMRSMLRLAASAWTVWEPILAGNANAIAEEVRGVAAVLSGMAEALETGRAASLADAFSAAAVAAGRLRGNGEPGDAVDPETVG